MVAMVGWGNRISIPSTELDKAEYTSFQLFWYTIINPSLFVEISFYALFSHVIQIVYILVMCETRQQCLSVVGFIAMTPQLFINYKLKSVAHLPWRMLTYKALNTFIDDLFAFVIKTPTLYRIGCFRDGTFLEITLSISKFITYTSSDY